MRFSFSEEQEALRRTARRFLEHHSTSQKVRAVMATETGYDAEVWHKIGGELGWTALIVPEAYGGLSGTGVELCALLEEMGRALLCAPFFSTVCLGTSALLSGGSEAQKQEHLPAIAAGTRTATLAHTESAGDGVYDGAVAAIRTTARRDADGYVLAGTKSMVVDGHTADLLVVTARLTDADPGAEDRNPEDGIALFLLPGGAPGVVRSYQKTLDMTRRLAEVKLRDVRVPLSARLGDKDNPAGWDCVENTLDRACIALSAEQVGGAQRCLDMAVEYAKLRVQFGRPIGSFQAIKHKCAEMLLQVESARSASYYASWASAHMPSELPLIAPLCKAYCSEAFFHCAAENIQIHGGIGFTWEHDAHLYFRRAKSSEILLGSPVRHREVLARRMGLLPADALSI